MRRRFYYNGEKGWLRGPYALIADEYAATPRRNVIRYKGIASSSCPLCRSDVPLIPHDPPRAPLTPWHIRGSDAACRYVESLGNETREWLIALYLANDLALLSVETLAIGSLSNVVIDCGLIISRGRFLGAEGFVLVHKHPSGDPNPSRSDMKVTQKLAQISCDCDLHMLSHLVISKEGQSCVGYW